MRTDQEKLRFLARYFDERDSGQDREVQEDLLRIAYRLDRLEAFVDEVEAMQLCPCRLNDAELSGLVSDMMDDVSEVILRHRGDVRP